MRPFLLMTVLAAVAGCRSYEGVYLPDCVAYAGETIELRDGRFEWDKFTDEVIVGDDGAIVDQFPDHPVAGTYRVEAGVVSFAADGGQALGGRHLVTVDGRAFLLADAEFAAYRERGQLPDCALVLGGPPER